jgi:hypothetical protein
MLRGRRGIRRLSCDRSPAGRVAGRADEERDLEEMTQQRDSVRARARRRRFDGECCRCRALRAEGPVTGSVVNFRIPSLTGARHLFMACLPTLQLTTQGRRGEAPPARARFIASLSSKTRVARNSTRIARRRGRALLRRQDAHSPSTRPHTTPTAPLARHI